MENLFHRFRYNILESGTFGNIILPYHFYSAESHRTDSEGTQSFFKVRESPRYSPPSTASIVAGLGNVIKQVFVMNQGYHL